MWGSEFEALFKWGARFAVFGFACAVLLFVTGLAFAVRLLF